jgi:hypothetical protein
MALDLGIAQAQTIFLQEKEINHASLHLSSALIISHQSIFNSHLRSRCQVWSGRQVTDRAYNRIWFVPIYSTHITAPSQPAQIETGTLGTHPPPRQHPCKIHTGRRL